MYTMELLVIKNYYISKCCL